MRERSGVVCAGLLALIVVATPALADHHEKGGHGEHGMTPEMQAMMAAWEKAGTPGEPHQQMAAQAGTWKATVRSFMGPGEPMVSEGTSKREMILDGRVLADHFEGNMMGKPFVGHGMSGYDNTSGKYWSTWNDSMSTGILVSWGHWDEAKKALVFEGTMANPMDGKPTKVKMTLSQPEAGKQIFEMWEPHGEGGEMVRTMEITYVKQ